MSDIGSPWAWPGLCAAVLHRAGPIGSRQQAGHDLGVTDDLVANGYDAVYRALPSSAAFNRIWRDNACGAAYPPQFEHISFLTLPEMSEMAGQLRVPQGGLLVDLACGAGVRACGSRPPGRRGSLVSTFRLSGWNRHESEPNGWDCKVQRPSPSAGSRPSPWRTPKHTGR
jgi:hypothetical protein